MMEEVVVYNLPGNRECFRNARPTGDDCEDRQENQRYCHESVALMRVLGKRGLRALERLMGMLLIMLAVQMLLNGVREFVQSLAAAPLG